MKNFSSLTVADAVARAAAVLNQTSPTPRADADILAMCACRLSRTDLITRAREMLTPQQRAHFDAIVERRRQGEPMAYITGRREFWSLDLEVSPATLIPRPETELLVERALAHLPLDCDAVVADLGTGCGAVALAIARERPRARLLAVDCSADALAIARTNAQRLGVANVEFRVGDWLAPLMETHVDMIVSNPPYVPADDPHLTQGDARFEPRIALAAGADGLDAIRRIAADASACLPAGGWLLLEHGWNQAAAVRTLLAHRGYASLACHRDLTGKDRVTECRCR